MTLWHESCFPRDRSLYDHITFVGLSVFTFVSDRETEFIAVKKPKDIMCQSHPPEVRFSSSFKRWQWCFWTAVAHYYLDHKIRQHCRTNCNLHYICIFPYILSIYVLSLRACWSLNFEESLACDLE